MVETEIMLYSLLWLDNILVIHSTVAMELLEMLCTFAQASDLWLFHFLSQEKLQICFLVPAEDALCLCDSCP